MIVLFTDFGPGPYVGQMRAVLYREAPGVPVIELLADAPAHNPRAAAYLLAALLDPFSRHALVLGVVDPGVGNAARKPVAVNVDGRWFVGPDNGLFNVVAMRGNEVSCWDIDWAAAGLSASFHGRDLFAPVAARLARGEAPSGRWRESRDFIDTQWPQDYPHIVYIDRFGNAMTGIRADAVARSAGLRIHGHVLPRVRTFSDVPSGSGFCYKNSMGLLEIAVNCGRADQIFNMAVDDAIEIVTSSENTAP